MVNTSSKKRPREASPSTEESESENEFQVEAIVDKRTRGKKIQYLLKWKGYSDADNTVQSDLQSEIHRSSSSSSGKIRIISIVLN